MLANAEGLCEALQVGLMWSEENMDGITQRKETKWEEGCVISLKESDRKVMTLDLSLLGQNQTLESSGIPKLLGPKFFPIHMNLHHNLSLGNYLHYLRSLFHIRLVNQMIYKRCGHFPV